MTGMPPFAIGMPVDPRDWKRGLRGFGSRREEPA
jgi:hypothetical protein